MNTPIYVLGVLGLCCIDFGMPTQREALNLAALRGCAVGVLGLRTRARRRVIYWGGDKDQSRLHTSPEKLNKPNTLNTSTNNPMNSLSFECVGSVLGWQNVCWVLFSEGWR
jgi:hypothetical protein